MPLREPSIPLAPEQRHSAHQVLNQQDMHPVAEPWISTACLFAGLQSCKVPSAFSPLHINASDQADTALQIWQLPERLRSISVPGLALSIPPSVPYVRIFRCGGSSVKGQSDSTPDGSAERSPQPCRGRPALQNPCPGHRAPSQVAPLRAQTHRRRTAELQKKGQAGAITGYLAKLLHIPT